MTQATIHQAKTQLSKLLKRVQRGETVVILHGKVPVAQLVPVGSVRRAHPKIGVPTTTGVRWSKDAFKAMTGAEMEAWGL